MPSKKSDGQKIAHGVSQVASKQDMTPWQAGHETLNILRDQMSERIAKYDAQLEVISLERVECVVVLHRIDAESSQANNAVPRGLGGGLVR